MSETIKEYFSLMRLNKPIGIFLLLWPTLWALWLAGEGKPHLAIVLVFIAGVILMRSAGCIINDFADRKVDGHVARTRHRPLVTGAISIRAAFFLFFILISCAFLLVLSLNRFTIALSFVGALLAVVYPFLKRYTHLPQVGLGLAFAWGVPMAFAAQNHILTFRDGLVFVAAVIWPVIYDTFYALVDRVDDKKIGIKSTAILLGNHCSIAMGLLQILFLTLLSFIGVLFHLKTIYFLCLIGVSLLFIYQQKLIQKAEADPCFKAFLNNNWVGLLIFLGIILSYENCC